MKRYIFEVVGELKNLTDEEKVNHLRTNASAALHQVLKYTYNPQYEFSIKEFPEQYKKSDDIAGAAYGDMESFLRKVYLFLLEHPLSNPSAENKRKQILIQNFLGMPHQECELVIQMFNKNIDGLNYFIVQKSFPGLLPYVEEPKVEPEPVPTVTAIISHEEIIKELETFEVKKKESINQPKRVYQKKAK